MVLDEIGSGEKPHYDAVKRILDEREGKPLVAISNLDLASVATVYDARVASRMAAGTLMELLGADRRMER